MSKIKTIAELSEGWLSNVKIGLCSGCFDLLHVGHMKHLEAAKSACDILIVAVASNENANKGPNRPAFDEKLRMEALACLESVDYVCLNIDVDSVALIKSIKPDYYIKGSEYRNKKLDINGKIAQEKAAVEEHGGKLIFTDEQVFSSTKLINEFINKKEKIDL